MNANERILQAGLRPTKARTAVLDALAQAPHALSHPEIVEILATNKEYDRVTIYRVLDWLTERGLIHRIYGENRAWKFQLSTQHDLTKPNKTKVLLPKNTHHHAHLHCVQCSSISCIHELSPHFPPAILKQFQVQFIDINLKGICLSCQSKSS